MTMRSSSRQTPASSAQGIQLSLGYLMTLATLVVFMIFQAPPLLSQEPDGGHADHEHQQEQEHDEVVKLDEAELQEFGIEITEAGPAIMQQILDLPGEIRPNDSKLAHIVPRFSGIVTEVRAQVGDRIRAGQVLAVIESDESLSPYQVKTLISGTVISKHITLGEAVSREHEAFVVADLSDIWVDITVYQRDIAHVAKGQDVLISGGHDLPEMSGKISYIAPIVDENTRTALARVVLPNPDGSWRPGTFITARIIVNRFQVSVAVPRTAIQMFEGRNVVFVATDEGFRPRPVNLGRTDQYGIEILSGLAPGEKYVSLGGFTLKAELGKGSLSGGHSH